MCEIDCFLSCRIEGMLTGEIEISFIALLTFVRLSI